MTDGSQTATALAQVSVATVTMVLLKRGMRSVWIRGLAPLRPDQARIAGPAFTLRYIPAREDLATLDSMAGSTSTRAAIEAMPEGCIAVADARGSSDGAMIGDILAARMRKRGVAGLVTDGGVRDSAGVRETGFPVWCSGAVAPPSIAGHSFVGWNQPIACGGVAILPGDWILADSDGAVVIPQDLVQAVLEAAHAQEEQEAWIVKEVARGQPLTGLYPMSDETRARYEADKD